jgi:redox-sensitive bicupin YhaK (pirin superfamily)
MKPYIRPSAERGHVNMGWLNTHHTFSFGEYRDGAHTHFGPIRVINDDIVAGGGGFPPHPHADMEILTYVLSGALAHKDSMGNGETIRAGDVQIMSAGTGITHSEFNPSGSEPVHLLQIWIFPETKDLTPRYEQKTLPDTKGLLPIAVPGGGESAVDITQAIKIHRWLGTGEAIVAGEKGVFVHAVAGPVTIDGHVLNAGDAVGLEGGTYTLKAEGEAAHALVFTF